MDARTARLRMLPVFEHDDGRAFSQHESRSVPGEGFARGAGLVRIRGGEGLQCIPRHQRTVIERRLAPAGDHHVDLAGGYSARGFADRHGGRRAGGGIGQVRPQQAILDTDPGRCRVGHGHQHAVGLDALGAFRIQREVAVVRRLSAAHAGADEDTGALAVRVAERETGIAHRLRGSHQGKLADAIQHAQLGRGEDGRRRRTPPRRRRVRRDVRAIGPCSQARWRAQAGRRFPIDRAPDWRRTLSGSLPSGESTPIPVTATRLTSPPACRRRRMLCSATSLSTYATRSPTVIIWLRHAAGSVGTVILNSSSTANRTSIIDNESISRSSSIRIRLQDFGRADRSWP